MLMWSTLPIDGSTTTPLSQIERFSLHGISFRSRASRRASRTAQCVCQTTTRQTPRARRRPARRRRLVSTNQRQTSLVHRAVFLCACEFELLAPRAHHTNGSSWRRTQNNTHTKRHGDQQLNNGESPRGPKRPGKRARAARNVVRKTRREQCGKVSAGQLGFQPRCFRAKNTAKTTFYFAQYRVFDTYSEN